MIFWALGFLLSPALTTMATGAMNLHVESVYVCMCVCGGGVCVFAHMHAYTI